MFEVQIFEVARFDPTLPPSVAPDELVIVPLITRLLVVSVPDTARLLVAVLELVT